MKHDVRRFAALALAAATALGGCSKGGPSAPEPPAAPVVADVVVSTTALAFGASVEELPVTIANPRSAAVAWRAEVSAPWLAVAPAAGTLAAGSIVITVRVERGALGAGPHAGEVRIVAGERSHTIAVSAEVPALALVALDRRTVDLGPDDLTATVRLTNVGNVPLPWLLSGPSWIAALPAAGTLALGASEPVALTPNRSALAPGTHQAEMTLTSDAGTESILVGVQVQPPARLRVQPAGLDFGVTTNALEARVINDGGRPLAWSASTSAPWAQLSRSSGTLPSNASEAITVSIDRAGLSEGAHRATLTVVSNGGEAAIAIDATIDAAATTALAGVIAGQFTGAGIGGLTVRLEGTATTTDEGGRFAIPGTPSSSLRTLTISGPEVHTRTTFARSHDSSWLMIPSVFDMAAFDDMAREYEPRTIRWLNNPRIYVDAQPEGFAPGPQLDQWIAEVQGVAAGFVSSWSEGAVLASEVTVTSSPPPDGTPGTIVIHFSEDPDRYSGPNTVGLARTWWAFRRDIVASAIWLRYSLLASSPTARTAVIGHELGHGMGMGHMDGATSSIMTPRISISSLSTFDRQAGWIVYSRSPGNSAPDTDSMSYYVGGLAPAAVGENTWVCGAPAP